MRDETTLQKIIRRGDRGWQVKRVQEWCCLHHLTVEIDSHFGPVTDFAVRQFQKMKRLKTDGTVGPVTFAAMIAPLLNALQTPAHPSTNFHETAARIARQHLDQHPREVGGQNMGPWVRLYMHGHEGDNFPWCAGFVSYILKQAATELGREPPIIQSVNCDDLAADALRHGRLITARQMREMVIHHHNGPPMTDQPPCAIFLRRRSTFDWDHTGFATEFGDNIFLTIEGNASPDFTNHGSAVISAIRPYNNHDFIALELLSDTE